MEEQLSFINRRFEYISIFFLLKKGLITNSDSESSQVKFAKSSLDVTVSTNARYRCTCYGF